MSFLLRPSHSITFKVRLLQTRLLKNHLEMGRKASPKENLQWKQQHINMLLGNHPAVFSGEDVYGAFFTLPLLSSHSCCGHPRFFQLQLEVAFWNGAKKKKSRKKLNFVRESQQEEDDVKQKKKKICVWLLARGGKREKVTVKQLFCYLMSF